VFNLTEDELMALVGRLYVGTIVRDRTIAELNAVVGEYDRLARATDDGPDGLLEDARVDAAPVN
jgi:hypothetical protein